MPVAFASVSSCGSPNLSDATKEFTSTPSTVCTGACTRDLDLNYVATHWLELPSTLRRAIIAMVRSASEAVLALA